MRPWGDRQFTYVRHDTPVSDREAELPDIQVDMKETIVDRGASIGLMEPLLVSDTPRHSFSLSDFAVDLAAKAAGLRRSLPGGVAGSLANLARAVNCYYSNLIQGHDTHPVDIERALKGDYSTDPRKRDLQLEAKAHLDACDQTRRNDLDGRGHLSEAALKEFTAYFLTTCIDQVEFMERLIQPGRLRGRILVWAEEEIRGKRLRPHSGAVLKAVLIRGELPRSHAARVLGVGRRQARRITSALLDRGVLTSASTRAPLKLAFPATVAHRWMPGLFPQRPTS